MSSPVMKFYFVAKKENTQKWNTIITVDKIDSDVYEWRCVTYYSYQQEFTKVHLNLEEIYLRVRSMMTLMNNVPDEDKYIENRQRFQGFIWHLLGLFYISFQHRNIFSNAVWVKEKQQYVGFFQICFLITNNIISTKLRSSSVYPEYLF